MKTLSIVNPCFNEEGNVRELYERVRAVMMRLGHYRYEHIFIDNSSGDGTAGILKELAAADRNVKVIVNTRNFGHIRSPFHAMLQARGDAVISLCSDLQDPPELIEEMVRHWENGMPVVIAVKNASEENRLMFWLRTKYYRLVNRVSNIETYQHFIGFGLYDRKVMDLIREFNDPYPYFRGMIAEVGLPHVEIPYRQPRRKRGITTNNLYTLYDMAMLGITNLSKVPLRLVTFSGFVSAVICIMVSFGYGVYKLMFWNNFTVGIAPLIIGFFFFASLQMIFLGIIGEYIGAIHTFVQKRPLVFEKERINFEFAAGLPGGKDLAAAQEDEYATSSGLSDLGRRIGKSTAPSGVQTDVVSPVLG
jgi:glycosyltransferase involved in cell wall biosynthesis